jgi:hypothetical protein
MIVTLPEITCTDAVPALFQVPFGPALLMKPT